MTNCGVYGCTTCTAGKKKELKNQEEGEGSASNQHCDSCTKIVIDEEGTILDGPDIR